MKRFKSLIFIMLLMLFIIPFTVHAEDNITFTASGAEVKVGQAFSIKVSETGANGDTKTLHAYSVTVKFDGNIIRYDGGTSPNGSAISQNGNEITIAISKQISDSTDIAELSFTAIKDGNSTIAVTNTCNINGEEGKCGSKSGNVAVKALGTDSTLSGLSIPNTPLTPAFNKNTKEYSANVKDVTSLTVNATASDPNASIQISENYKSLQKGNNEINIVVTSENGAKKTNYKINVNLELTPTQEELMKANANLNVLEIKGQKIEFNPEEVKYYIDVPYDTKELEVTATPVNPNAQVAVTGNDKLIVGKNTINIVVTAEDTTTTKTYLVVVTRQEAKKKIVPTCPDTTSTKEWIIFSVGLFLTFTLGIILGYILCKNDVLKKIFKKKVKEEEAVEIQSLSDTIDLSDTIEELKDEEDVKKA